MRAPHLVGLHSADDVVLIVAGGATNTSAFPTRASSSWLRRVPSALSTVEELSRLARNSQRSSSCSITVRGSDPLFEDLGQQEAGFASSGKTTCCRGGGCVRKLTDRVDFSDVADQGDMVSDRKKSVGPAMMLARNLGICRHGFPGEVEVDQLPPHRLGILNDRDLLDLDLALGEVFQGKQSVGRMARARARAVSFSRLKRLASPKCSAMLIVLVSR
ncbi:MAG: hypothetical protein Ct9H300mP1_08970 [Planctomycetaceae bacterium]|nr:MAG: hypothetical protein Ct9H300mP1_08970 [Planctomycetaceae bacterium]